MSKLTREVKYLSESDRPKKVEALSFSDWNRAKHNLPPRSIECISEWRDGTLDLYATEYANYLQEFTAEEKAVEFLEWFDNSGIKSAICEPNSYDSVIYVGKCNAKGDVFIAVENGYFTIYKGKLNSGKF